MRNLRVLFPALLMSAFLLLYMWLVAVRAWELVRVGEWAPRIMGAALFILPALALWWCVAEWRLAWQVHKMSRTLDRAGQLPTVPGEVLPSGRVKITDPAALIDEMERLLAAQPDSWQTEFRVAYAFDAIGQRAQARRHLQNAAELFRRSV